MLMQILLGIEKSMPESPYAHVLAFNEKGRAFLSEYKKSERRITLYSNLSPEDCEGNRDLATDVRADDIYSVINGKSIYEASDYVCKPMSIKV